MRKLCAIRPKGKLRIFQGEDELWYWELKAPNGKVIAVSNDGYTRRDRCAATQTMIAVEMREADVVYD